MVRKVVVANDKQDLLARLQQYIQYVADNAPTSENYVKVGLSGGSMVQMLGSVLPALKTDWKRWRFFFCDERIVPFDSKDSTFGCYKTELIPKLGITEDQFIAINPSLTGPAAAKDYAEKMAAYFKELPVFDLLLLGMGPDGHTCSLFPGHPLLNVNDKWVADIADSPKPPPCRVTLTLPVINNAKLALFPISGAEKAPTVLKVLHPDKGESPLPAALVQPSKGDVVWLLDADAARLLPQ